MASSSAAYDGGACGKFRKNTSRISHTTPYDRPITALRRPTQTPNNNINNNNRWLSKIIDPATKLINSGANKLFSSVFRKHPTDEVKKIEYMQPENATNVGHYATNLPVTCGDNGFSAPSNSNGVAELEDILKQKTFTRSEIDQLTALILSRTTENSNGAEKGMSEPKLVDLQAVHTRRDKLSKPANEYYIEHTLSGDISTPKVRSKVLPEDVASPVEIAKAYMASTHCRLPEVSPSVLCLQNQLPKENTSTPYSSLSKSRSPAMYLNQKTVGDIRTSGNGFMTPMFRGGSIVHSMRAPNSRVRPVSAFKAAETNFNIGGGSPYHNNHHKKQVLKRRSSVLENDIGFVGSIHRVRQKPNFLHPKIPEVRSSVEGSFQNGSISNMPVVNSLPGTSSRYVPSRSIEMAQKIFEQLDKFSPKGNLKMHADVSVENSPTLKRLPKSQDFKESKGSLDSVHEHSHPTETPSMVEEVSAKKFTSPSFSFGPQDGADSRHVSYLSSKSKADHPMKKRAIEISAHEDCPKMDDDVPSNEVARSTPLTEEGHHAESPGKSVAFPDVLSKDQTNAVEKLPEIKTTANKTILDAVSAPQSTLESDEVAPQMEKSNIFAALSSKSDNLPPFVCAPQSAAKDSIEELPVSANKVAAEVNSPGKSVNNNSPVFDNPVINSGNLPSVQALSNGSQINTTTLSNGGGQLTFTPSSFASKTTDISCDKSNATTTATSTTVTTSSLLNATPCALSIERNRKFSFTAPTLESTGCYVQPADPATTNKPTFSFQPGSTPVSGFDFTSAPPSFSDQSTSSVSAPAPTFVFGSSQSTGLTSGSRFGSISANPFSSGPTTTSSALGNTFTSSSVSTSSTTTPSIFSFTSQSPKPTTTMPSTSPLPAISFGTESSGVTSSSFTFGATANSSSASNTPFVFGANSALAASTPDISNSPFHSQPSTTPTNSQPFSFISTTPTNSRQIPMEDTMAEDSPPGFGAQASAPSGGFGFNAPSAVSSPFQFNTQQSPIAPQNPLFQPSVSGEFNGGSGTFSLGTADKSQRRIIRVKRGVRSIKKP